MALLANDDLDLERYLHQLMPAALTCCVARRLGAAPADDHWVCCEGVGSSCNAALQPLTLLSCKPVVNGFFGVFSCCKPPPRSGSELSSTRLLTSQHSAPVCSKCSLRPRFPPFKP